MVINEIFVKVQRAMKQIHKSSQLVIDSESLQMPQIIGAFTRKISVRARPVLRYSLRLLGHCERLYRTKWNFKSMALLRTSIIDYY